MSDSYMLCEYGSDEFRESERCFICTRDNSQEKLKSNRTMLKCGGLGVLVIPSTAIVGSSFTLTTLSLNVKDFKYPCIKFEFASNILATGATRILHFQLFKQCRGSVNSFPIGPVWSFSSLIALNDTFSFHACDCDICDDECCVYSVIVTVAGIVPDDDNDDETPGNTNINNASLSAVIVDSV